jgi:hypothetical protein
MTHAEQGTLLSYIDGELAPPEVDALEGHLPGCAACRTDLEDVRGLAREATSALGLISAEPSVAEARANLERRRDGRVPLHGPRPWRFATAGLLKAAAIVLALAGAASAAIPGTPLNRLAAALLDRVRGSDTAPAGAQAPAEPVVAEPAFEAQEPAGASAGLVLSAEGQMRISVHTVDPSARIDVRLVDGPGSIRALTDSDDVRFKTGPGYVEVYDVRAGLLIEVPRRLRAASVEVNGRAFWTKPGDTGR